MACTVGSPHSILSDDAPGVTGFEGIGLASHGSKFCIFDQISVGDTALCEPWLSSECAVPRPVLLLRPSTREAAWGQQLLAGEIGGTADLPRCQRDPTRDAMSAQLHNCSLLLMLLLSG